VLFLVRALEQFSDIEYLLQEICVNVHLLGNK
jgi:hypothetical protein